jgi:hypothetical protein
MTNKDLEKIKREIKNQMFVYEHFLTSNTKEALCEQCREVIANGTPCKSSPHYLCWKFLDDILSTLSKEEEK